MAEPLHPIVTVAISPYISAQGPTVEPADPRRNALPIDMLATLRASEAAAVARAVVLEAALQELARDPREDGICAGDGWDFYTDSVNFARKFITPTTDKEPTSAH